MDTSLLVNTCDKPAHDLQTYILKHCR